MKDILVIGVGNAYRTDDAVGLVVAQRLHQQLSPGIRVIEQSGEGTTLIEAWAGFDHVFLADATKSGQEPGSIQRFDASTQPLPVQFFNYSTHVFSVAEAVEMARQLGQLPPTLVIYGIEGKTFSFGTDMTLEVKEAGELVVQRLLLEVEALNVSIEITQKPPC